MTVRMNISGALSAPPFGWHQDVPTVAPGTVWLFDPLLPSGAISGVPANNAVIPNAARLNAAALLSVGDPTTLNAVFRSVAESNSTMRVERSSKGGIHVMHSQTLQASATNNRGLIFLSGAGALQTFLSGAVPGKTIYAFSARRITREQVSASPVPYFGVISSASDNVWLYKVIKGGSLLGSGLGVKSATIAGVMCSAVAVTAWTGTKPAGFSYLFGGSAASTASGSAFVNGLPSVIEYRSRVADLSLEHRANGGAGGTMEEEFEAAWQEDLARMKYYLGKGGPLYGDTWSDPLTTLP